MKIKTSAAITHTALVGRMDATISPAPNAIGVIQDLHLLILITLYILRRKSADVTELLKKTAAADIMDAVIA